MRVKLSFFLLLVDYNKLCTTNLVTIIMTLQLMHHDWSTTSFDICYIFVCILWRVSYLINVDYYLFSLLLGIGQLHKKITRDFFNRIQ